MKQNNVLIDPMIPNLDRIDSAINKVLFKMELRMLRDVYKMTQQDVSKASGLSVQCISDIESTSTGNPTLRSITKYLDVFGYELAVKEKVIK